MESEGISQIELNIVTILHMLTWFPETPQKKELGFLKVKQLLHPIQNKCRDFELDKF